MGSMIGDIASAVGAIATPKKTDTIKWKYKLVGVKKDMLLGENGQAYAHKISQSIHHNLHHVDYLLLRQKNEYDNFMIFAYGIFSPFKIKRAPLSDLRLTKKDIKYFEFKRGLHKDVRLQIISKLGINPDNFYKAEGGDFDQADGDTQVKVTTNETPKDTSTPTTTIVIDKTLQPKKEESFYHKHKIKIFVLGALVGLGLGYHYSKKSKS